jgi:hypothetical protein
MKKLNLSKEAQVKAILAESYCGVDDWSETYLGVPSNGKKAIKFSDVFNISEKEVLDHVRRHGWDARTVNLLKTVPERNPENDKKYVGKYVFITSGDGVYNVAELEELERGQWVVERFQSATEAELFIIRKLFSVQRRFWG